MPSALGGQEALEQMLWHLRLTEAPASSSTSDAVIVSLDLEVSRRCRGAILMDKKYQPSVREVGIASIDTRHIFNEAAQGPPASSKRRIKTQQFSTLNASKDFEDCDVTDFKECEFAETFLITPEQLIPVVTAAVRIQETEGAASGEPGTGIFRNVIVIGHFIDNDLAVLKRLGLNMYRGKAVVAILDTHTLSKAILTGERATDGYSLPKVMTELGCPYEPYELHNTGNDATYTLHVMLMLAVAWMREHQSMMEAATESYRTLRSCALAEANSVDRWKPVRSSLGAHVDEVESE